MHKIFLIAIVLFGISIKSFSQSDKSIPTLKNVITKLEERNKTIDNELLENKVKKLESEKSILKAESREKEAINKGNKQAAEIEQEVQKTHKRSYNKYILKESKLLKEKNNNDKTISQLYRAVMNIPEHKKHLVAGVSTNCSGNTLIKHSDGTQSDCNNEALVLMKGDVIKTSDDSKLRMYVFEEAMQVDVNAATNISLQEETIGDMITESLKLLSGKIYSQALKKLQKKFEVRTPTAVCAVRGTQFETTVTKEGDTEIHLFEGEVEIENTFTKEKTFLKPGQKISIYKDGKSTGPQEFDIKEIKKWWED